MDKETKHSQVVGASSQSSPTHVESYPLTSAHGTHSTPRLTRAKAGMFAVTSCRLLPGATVLDVTPCCHISLANELPL